MQQNFFQAVVFAAILLSGLSNAQDTPPPAAASAALNYVEDTETVPEQFAAVLYGMLEDVRVLPEGRGEWLSVAKPVALKVKSEIQTAKGKTKIRLAGQGQVRLPPFSHLMLDQLKDESVTLVLRKGKIWNKMISQPDQEYVVRTPELTAGVRGALYAMQIDEQQGTRLSVFDGEVGVIPKGGRAENLIIVKAGQELIIAADGSTSGVQTNNAVESREWDEWDAWALEVHEEIGSHFVFGGDAISNLARIAAMDAQRAEAINAEAAANIYWNREGDHVDGLRNAFFEFYKDTGHQPTAEEGFRALIENIGNWPDWKGPYLTGADAALPPRDRWGGEIQYLIVKTPGGKEVPAVISNGPDKRFSQGKVDDVMSYVNYRQVQRE